MTQNDRVLARLRIGPVAAVEFQPPGVCDGGSPIWRVAARIDNLKARGFVIRSEREPDGTATYRLVSEPGAERALSEAKGPSASEQVGPGSVPPSGGVRPTAPAESLFDTGTFAERGDYRDADAA